MTEPARRTVMLSDVLVQAREISVDRRPYFHRPERLTEIANTSDVVLYRAISDVAPPYRDRFGWVWRLDHVDYTGSALGTGEFNRSIGHWNPDDQFEIFEVVAGRVVMIVAEPGRAGYEVLDCRAGTGVALAPGAWHLTYAPDGPAGVQNIYSRTVDDHAGKYHRRAPLRLGLRADRSDRPALFAPTDQDRPYDAVVVPGARLPITGSLLDLFHRPEGREDMLDLLCSR